jgi:hypothetical protein
VLAAAGLDHAGEGLVDEELLVAVVDLGLALGAEVEAGVALEIADEAGLEREDGAEGTVVSGLVGEADFGEARRIVLTRS